MYTEWTGLKVDAKCLDPRPPQMEPPNIYPEGIPFMDARPPQDRPDRLEDQTALQSAMGGMSVTPGVSHPAGQNQLPGAYSPLPLIASPDPLTPETLADDVTFLTGAIPAPMNTYSVDPSQLPPDPN